MGQLISLTDRIAERDQERVQGGAGGAAFFFALDCPVSYLVAERVERDLGEIAWMPTLVASSTAWGRERLRQARMVAEQHRLPLVEPDNFPFDARPVTRAAVFAASHGAGASFALAAMRMAFAGGFDLSDPDVIAEAAAAASMPIDDTVQAATESAYDASVEVSSRGLLSRGILEPPVVRIGGGWFSGFDALGGNSAFSAARASYQAHAGSAEPA